MGFGGSFPTMVCVPLDHTLPSLLYLRHSGESDDAKVPMQALGLGLSAPLVAFLSM
jgi:hypothetical protein